MLGKTAPSYHIQTFGTRRLSLIYSLWWMVMAISHHFVSDDLFRYLSGVSPAPRVPLSLELTFFNTPFFKPNGHIGIHLISA